MPVPQSTLLAIALALLGFLAAGPAMFMHPQTSFSGVHLAPTSLIGIIACAARPSGEAYAPDEIEALTEFAHGSGAELVAQRVELREELRAMRAAFERA
jgi:hypothetical protein